MQNSLITGTGLFTPRESISNEELVKSFNTFVYKYNAQHSKEIENGTVTKLQESSADFIEKASGIKSRYVSDKENILNPDIMRPLNLERDISEYSLQCDMAVSAAKEALTNANLNKDDIDVVIAACSNMPRPYPALAVEIQDALEIENCKSFDLNVACASAAFAIDVANSMIQSKSAKNILVVNPEICSAHLNFRDRDSHFIFGDACTAIVLQNENTASSENVFSILKSTAKTKFSRNIYNNFGYLSLTNEKDKPRNQKLFVQEGRKVFKDIVPMVSGFITETINAAQVPMNDVSRFWLHQANININDLIAKKITGGELDRKKSPVILDEYANTSSAGSIITFHKNSADLVQGEIGIISAFGAGYSMGCSVLQKL